MGGNDNSARGETEEQWRGPGPRLSPEWPALASDGDTYAPTEMIAEEVPPGAPTVDRAGPALPAEETKMTPCLWTMSSARSMKRPLLGSAVASPYDMLMMSTPCWRHAARARERPTMVSIDLRRVEYGSNKGQGKGELQKAGAVEQRLEEVRRVAQGWWGHRPEGARGTQKGNADKQLVEKSDGVQRSPQQRSPEACVANLARDNLSPRCDCRGRRLVR